nr:MAG: replication initiator protein [Microvirus sp.]
MPCYRPISAYRSRSGRSYVPGDAPGYPSGKWPVVFSVKDGYPDMPVVVPCGQCIGCRLERSRQWAVRCVHEAKLHAENCFITLTYDDVHLPRSVDLETGEINAGVLPSLNKRDIQLFFKRFRKRFGEGIRYFQCGEYGSLHSRPHHHAIVFGFDFPDKVLLFEKRGVKLFSSAILSELWPHGLSSIGDVTFESAAYVARYILKKINGEKADDHYVGRLPEYVTMSRRPGIAHDYYEQYGLDIYANDLVFIRDNVVARPPRYYDRLYDLTNHSDFARICLRRRRCAVNGPDNSFERLVVRERVQFLRSKQLTRSLD